MLRTHSLIAFCIFVLLVPAVVVAQQQQYGNQQLLQTAENMAEIKEQLDKRSMDLQAEWEALQKEREELARMAGGGTLRGSKLNKYMQRNSEYNARMMKYQEENGKLRQDMEAYEAAVKNMGAAMHRQSEGGASSLTDALNSAGINASLSGASQEEIYQITNLLNNRRAELLEEYNSLKAEQQRISMQGHTGQASSISEQVYQVNAKLKEFAQKRDRFNNAVTAVNEILGQNVQPLPGP